VTGPEGPPALHVDRRCQARGRHAPPSIARRSPRRRGRPERSWTEAWCTPAARPGCGPTWPSRRSRVAAGRRPCPSSTQRSPTRTPSAARETRPSSFVPKLSMAWADSMKPARSSRPRGAGCSSRPTALRRPGTRDLPREEACRADAVARSGMARRGVARAPRVPGRFPLRRASGEAPGRGGWPRRSPAHGACPSRSASGGRCGRRALESRRARPLARHRA
jgi:hypothetical protein